MKSPTILRSGDDETPSRLINFGTSMARAGSTAFSQPVSYSNSARYPQQNMFQLQGYKPMSLSEVLSYADKANDLNIKQRAETSEQDIKYNKQFLEQIHPILDKALRMEMKSKLPYNAYENNAATARNAINAGSQLASSLSNTYTNSMARLNPVSMSL